MKSDHGTFEARTRGNKVEVAADSTVGGATCMIDRWHSYADFLLDLKLISQDHHDAFSEFNELWYAANGKHKPGGQGDGSKYQDWIRFGALLGPSRLRILNDIRESDTPSSAYQCASVLNAAVKAQRVASQAGQRFLAEEIDKQIDRLQNLLKMRESIIESHRQSAILMRKTLHDAMEAAQEAFKIMLDDKRKSEL